MATLQLCMLPQVTERTHGPVDQQERVGSVYQVISTHLGETRPRIESGTKCACGELRLMRSHNHTFNSSFEWFRLQVTRHPERSAQIEWADEDASMPSTPQISSMFPTPSTSSI
jgi:hypothetical protein